MPDLIVPMGAGVFRVERPFLLRYIALEEAQPLWRAHADVLEQQSDIFQTSLVNAEAQVRILRRALRESRTLAASIEDECEQRLAQSERRLRAEQRGRRLDRFLTGGTAILVLAGGAVAVAVVR